VIGALRTRVRLYTPTEVEDAGGGRALGEVELGLVWAEVSITRSSEDGTSGRARTTQYVEAVVRSRSELVRGMTLVCGGVRYRVFATAPYDPRGRYTRLLAEEDIT
jgi:head-tail adaptor